MDIIKRTKDAEFFVKLLNDFCPCYDGATKEEQEEHSSWLFMMEMVLYYSENVVLKPYQRKKLEDMACWNDAMRKCQGEWIVFRREMERLAGVQRNKNKKIGK